MIVRRSKLNKLEKKMSREETLKKELKKIKEDNWNIPCNIDSYSLSIEMMEYIGTTDAFLRDKLILNMFYKILEGKKISYKQIKEILWLCLSDKHVFFRLGLEDDDSVFNRTFSILIVEAILYINNKEEKEFLCEGEILEVYKKVMEYFRKEKDLRGFVQVKGWAHSAAHTADALLALSESKYLKEKELREILQAIKDKICVSTYTYINEEDERLVNTFMGIYNRKLISDEEYINWIYSFENVTANGEEPAEEHLRENRKLFLRSLYFRFKKFNLDEKIIEVIEEVLGNLPAFY